jgi:murein DD-endopeptidase MepM/ murein hydrolase activator NlpD
LIDGASALSSAYGLRRDPFTGRVHQHAGIDVSAAQGTPVAALAAGTVVYAGWRPGYGNTVIIRHEAGLESLYAHLSKALVKVGDQVEARTPIANVGSGGRSTGAHLHFEVRKSGRTIDPLSHLG